MRKIIIIGERERDTQLCLEYRERGSALIDTIFRFPFSSPFCIRRAGILSVSTKEQIVLVAPEMTRPTNIRDSLSGLVNSHPNIKTPTLYDHDPRQDNTKSQEQ